MEDTRSIVLGPGEMEHLIEVGMEVLKKLEEVDVLLARLVQIKEPQDGLNPVHNPM